MRRLVVDASTLTSGVASRPGGGTPWLLLLALIDLEFEAIVCPRLIQEFSDALGNRYFQERFDARDLDGIVTSVTGVATMYDDPVRVEPLLRDADDDYLVALARQSGAEAIVSGDKDLLDHPGLEPPAIDARSTCKVLGLLD
ncbi:MAG: putative toxin-antitoxin system toxin component, PIN family [Actinobacteria bacterium]|nr:putative toxin-antitoxin system toxin component, PIN family [Actinomycetota bacterium]